MHNLQSNPSSLELIRLSKHSLAIRTKSMICFISQFVSISSLSPTLSCFVSHLSSVSIPKKVQAAISDFGWRQAMELEMKALHHNGTWELVPLPPNKKTVGCEWVYTVKFHPDGSIE